VLHFRTYAAAAEKAFEQGLMDGAAVERVLSAIEADMQADETNIAPGSPNELLLLEEIEAARAARPGMPRLRRLAGALKRSRPWRKRASAGDSNGGSNGDSNGGSDSDSNVS